MDLARGLPDCALAKHRIDEQRGHEQRILKIEKVEGTTRRDLQDDDAASLTSKAAPTLGALIERAFEAGIACVLGVRAEREEADESDEEAELRRALLEPLMEGTRANTMS